MSARNSLKIRVLRALEKHGWLRPRELHTRAGFPLRSSPWTYMKRQERWGLVRKRVVSGIGPEWTITRRGRDRLVWLQRPK
jgi:hypothetical protein